MLHFHKNTIISLLISVNFTKSSEIYKRLGQFDYGQPHCTTDHIDRCISKDSSWVYIGEVRGGASDTPHGIGIQVWYPGGIGEGYWKDGKLHGRGRAIYNNGDYYIGEYKEGSRNGQGTYYDTNGDRYEGGWKDGWKYGQGTLYFAGGDKYTGQWDGNKGQGEVCYADGTKYKGHWNLPNRHRLSTLYSAHGHKLKQDKLKKYKYIG